MELPEFKEEKNNVKTNWIHYWYNCPFWGL
jgi:hypothetical protein